MRSSPFGKTSSAALKNFLLLFLPTAAILTGILILAAYSYQTVLKDAVSQKERSLTALASNILESDMAARFSDVEFLAVLAAMHLEESKTNPKAVQEMAKELSLFAETDGAYLRIIYLNIEGQIILRLVMTPEGPRDTSLEQPSQSEYESMANDSASRFELIAENEAHKSSAALVIRFFTPVFDDGDKAIGQLVLDYNGTRLLDDLRHEADRSFGSVWLLDSKGRWLIGPDPDKSWAVMHGGKTDQTMGASFPEAWKEIAGRDSGQFFTKQGLFTFEATHLKSAHEFSENWIIVTFVKPDAFVPEWLRSAVGLHVALLFFLAVVIWFWANGKSRRTAAEEALRQNERKLRAISESSLDAVVMIDGRDRIQYWNPAAERMFGYAAAEILGQRCHALLALDEHLEDAHKGMADFARTGKGSYVDKIIELSGTRKDGSIFPVEMAVSPVPLDGQWGAVGSIRDITQRKIDEERLWELATIDGLTGAANRRHFMENVATELEKAKRYKDEASFIMFDVDNFKNINDAHGHDAGDAVLRGLAEVCRNNLREVDVFGRVGGEEFAVFLPRTDLGGAERAAERLRAAVEKAVIEINGLTLGVTISLGAAALDHEDDSLDGLYKRADVALYAAKIGGRNRVETA